MGKANICHPVCVCGAKSKSFMSQFCRSALARWAYRWSFTHSSDNYCFLLHDSFMVSYNEAVSFTVQQEQRNLEDYSEQSVSKSPIHLFNTSVGWEHGRVMNKQPADHRAQVTHVRGKRERKEKKIRKVFTSAGLGVICMDTGGEKRV